MTRQTQLLQDENERSSDKLSRPTEQVFRQITQYIRTAPINGYQQECIRRDILQMLLDAEAQGRTAEDVLGADYRAFCDSVIAELPPISGRTRTLGALRDVLPAAAILLLIWLAGRLAEYAAGLAVWPALTVTVGDVLGGVLLLAVASAAVTMICRTAFSTRKRVSALLFVLLFIGLFAALCAGFFLKQPLLTVHFLTAPVAALVLFAAYKLLDAKLD